MAWASDCQEEDLFNLVSKQYQRNADVMLTEYDSLFKMHQVFKIKNNLVLDNSWKITYYKLYKFLDKSYLIYSLKLEFKQKYSTTHALTDLIPKKIGAGCKKAVADAQTHLTWWGKKIYLQHYAVKNKVNSWFASTQMKAICIHKWVFLYN